MNDPGTEKKVYKKEGHEGSCQFDALGVCYQKKGKEKEKTFLKKHTNKQKERKRERERETPPEEARLLKMKGVKLGLIHTMTRAKRINPPSLEEGRGWWGFKPRQALQ